MQTATNKIVQNENSGMVSVGRKGYTSDLAGQVDEVIRRRKPILGEVEAACAQLSVLRDSLVNVAALEEKHAELEKFSGLVGTLLAQADELVSQSGQLRSRFSRRTVNVGVVGLPGQGKSLLLRNISGLGRDIIPEGKGEFVTGCRSMIMHRKDSTPCAEIDTYDEKSFLEEVIAPYFKELKLDDAPASLDDFAAFDLSKSKPRGATGKSMLVYLRSYQENLDGYRELLTGKTVSVPKKDIMEYVAQRNPETGEKYQKYMAVRMARIYCSFPHVDMGRVALLDMPGLGENRAGERERLLKTVGDEVDFILFVKKPGEDRAAWESRDTELYDAAAGAFVDSGRPVAEMSFLVLNHKQGDDGGNLKNCQSLKRDVDQAAHFQVAKSVIADVSKPDRAREDVVLPVLEYLAENIGRLDHAYVRDFLSRVDNVIDRARQLGANIASTVDGAVVNRDMFFNRKFGEFRKKLCNVLGNHVRSLELETLKKGYDDLTKRVFKMIDEDNQVPDKEQVACKADEKGSLRVAFGWYLNTMRNQISWHFEQMDDWLGDFSKIVE